MPTALPDTDEQRGPGTGEPALPRGAVAGATAAVLVLHLWATSRIGHPSVVYDEAGYLGNARWLAGAGAGWEMPWSPRYAVGYPLAIAPLTRLFPDPAAQWRAILVLNSVLLASVLPLLHAVARRVLGAAPRTALLAAALGAVAPAVVAAGVSAIAENLVLPLVPLAVLATWALCRPGRAWTRLGVGPCLVALYATHPRFTVALPVGVAVLGWALWRRLAPRSLVAVNAVLLAAGALGTWALTRAVEAARWDHVERLEGGPAEVRSLATSWSGLGELAWTAAGQAWYLAAGSIGLAVIGVVVVARRAWPPLGVGPGGRGTGAAQEAEARAVALASLLALAAGVFAVSVAFFAQNQFRADHLVYGRHNDSFTPVWVTAALVGLAGASRRRVLQACGGTVAVVGGLFLVLLATRQADAFGGRYSPFAVPALVRSVGGDPSGVFWRATLAALVGLAVVALVAGVARRPRLLVAPLVVAAAWSGLGTVEGTEFYQGWSYASWTADDEVRRLGVTAIEVDGRGADGFPALAYPFHLPEVRFTTYEPARGETPTEPFVLARTEDEHLDEVGARIALLDTGGFYPDWGLEDGMALWVQPGPEHDRLAAGGALLPAGFPTGLPAPARRSAVEVLDRADAVEIVSGDAVTLRVRVRHTGSGAPWPDRASYGGAARVRVVAQVEPLDDGLPVGARSGGELPRWVRPGDTVTTEVTVAAVGPFLEPLPPGRYRVTLGVGQGEPEWFAPGGEGAALDLVVTG